MRFLFSANCSKTSKSYIGHSASEAGDVQVESCRVVLQFWISVFILPYIQSTDLRNGRPTSVPVVEVMEWLTILSIKSQVDILTLIMKYELNNSWHCVVVITHNVSSSRAFSNRLCDDWRLFLTATMFRDDRLATTTAIMFVFGYHCVLSQCRF